jgi:hypothetical protein
MALGIGQEELGERDDNMRYGLQNVALLVAT